MRSRPANRRRWTLLGGLVAFAFAPLAVDGASGDDSPGFTRAALTKGVPDAGRTTGSIRCPASHPHPTGGGIEIGGAPGGLGFEDLEVSTTAPTIGESGWVAEANNHSGSAAQMTVTAICAKRGKYKYPFADKPIPPDDQVQKTVSCPDGTKVVGGGAETSSASFSVQLASSVPADGADRDSNADDGWLGAANNQSNSDQRLFVTAVCAESGRYKYVHSPRIPLPDDTQVAREVNCPNGTQITGGGVDITGIDLGIEVAGTFPIENGWRAAANNDSSGRDERMQTVAICKTPNTRSFSGTFSEGGTVSFSLTDDGTKIHNWTWVHMPVQCREGSDVNSSHYRSNVEVTHHHFHAQGVSDPEGFKTTLDGTLTNHDTQAHGTLTMRGPEPPNRTRCHGTGHWSATAQ
jgi:hypothetical protein